MPQGTLFTEDFLNEGILGTEAWRSVTSETLAAFREKLQAIVKKVANPERLNEAQTEERIVKPILESLGWEACYWVQERLETKGRANVPDYLFFGSPEDFAQADRRVKAGERYPLAIAVGDAKAWLIGLDRRGSGAGANETPSGQILRYLSRAEVQSERKVQWGILTNGRHWRLYYQGAKSRLEEYFEIDLAWVLSLPGIQGDLEASSRPAVFATDKAWTEHLLKVFSLMFRREAFLPGTDGRTFHLVALAEAREWEARVRESLAGVVFGEVFPNLMRALKRADPEAPEPLDATYLAIVREAAFTLLYRILFALYAEDRDLLPKRDPKYGGLSSLRDEVAERIDAGTQLSGRRKSYAHVCSELFITIDKGDDTLGVPPYNGGLFSDETPATDLLTRAALPDADFAPLLDRLARTEKNGRRVRINFRDLSVQQLGSIYERLLEFEPVVDPAALDGITIRLNSFARKGSGSYYTPDDLVKLIIERTVGPLVQERVDAFRLKAATLAHDKRRMETRLEELAEADPAVRILDLKVVDPAMGSGHFLVSLVDYLSDAVTAAMGEAHHVVDWADYISPLDGRLNAIRKRIREEANAHGWLVRDDQIVNKNLIKRFILKRCVYGVDKNPMAVELAKVGLWLHTFTAGAPLSFLNHHLKCGDSLFGEHVRNALDELAARGGMLINDEVRKAEGAIAGMQTVETLTDAEIAEVRASAAAFHDVEARILPLEKFLNFWHASDWLDLSDEENAALGAALDGAFGQPIAVLGALHPPSRPSGLTEESLRLFDEGAEEQFSMRALGGAGTARDFRLISDLIERAHKLAAKHHFLHWQIAFLGIWKNWTSVEPEGGFDAVIGNPPWDKIEVDEVTWFRTHDPQFAGLSKVKKSELRKVIDREKKADSATWKLFEEAREESKTAVKVARDSGDYPGTSKGRADVYALFVERAQSLLSRNGRMGLLVPTGMVADSRLAQYFNKLCLGNHVRYIIDFENRLGPQKIQRSSKGRNRVYRQPFFADIDSRFRFSVFVTTRSGGSEHIRCAFMSSADVASSPDSQLLVLSSEDFALLNPNTKTAVFFNNQHDIDLSRRIYRSGKPLYLKIKKAFGLFPVTSTQMLNMSTDRGTAFIDIDQAKQEGFYPAGLGIWKKGNEELRRLFVGKMIHQFDHRFASVDESEEAEENDAVGVLTTAEEHMDADFVPRSRYWTRASAISFPPGLGWCIGFRDIARVTDARTCIASFIPIAGAGHTLPLIIPDSSADLNAAETYRNGAFLLLANVNCMVFDYSARMKVQTTHLSWYILEQLPIIPIEKYSIRSGKRAAAEIVKDHVLRLTYTANDMAAFARDMGYANKDNLVKSAFVWNEAERRHLRARLDALYFILYGITNDDDIRYILSTFPIVERKDRDAFGGVYLTRELILWYKHALEAGDSDALAPEAEVIRLAKARGD